MHPTESDQFPDYITDIFAKLNKWFQTNNLLNIDKTNCIKFPNNKTSVNWNAGYGNKTIEEIVSTEFHSLKVHIN